MVGAFGGLLFGYDWVVIGGAKPFYEAFFGIGTLPASQGRWEDALEEIDTSLLRNTLNHKARALKATVLRHLDGKDKAKECAEASLAINGFNCGCLFELYLLTNEESYRERMAALMHNSPYNYDELALD